ncbi:hypothetical protein BGZ65_008683, partial [Modicella reniformis]
GDARETANDSKRGSVTSATILRVADLRCPKRHIRRSRSAISSTATSTKSFKTPSVVNEIFYEQDHLRDNDAACQVRGVVCRHGICGAAQQAYEVIELFETLRAKIDNISEAGAIHIFNQGFKSRIQPGF